MIARRDFIILLGGAAAAWPLAARAEQTKVSRIGFLRVGPPPPSYIGGLREGLREQGLVEGQHFVIEYALAQTATQISEAAVELAARKVDIIVAAGTPSVFPARDAAGQILVVFVATFDPVATGLVTSLARPGGNVTGMTTISGDLIAKRLELTKEMFPSLAKIAILVRDTSPTAPQYVEQSRSAAQKLGLELQILTEHHPNDFEKLIAAARGSGALVLGDDTEFTTYRTQIAEIALRNQLPTVHGLREMVEAGGLMSYGASFRDLYRRAASQVNKVLQGVKAGDLPIEQPTPFVVGGSPFDPSGGPFFVKNERTQRPVDHDLHAGRRLRHDRLGAYGHPANKGDPLAGGGCHKITMRPMTPAFTLPRQAWAEEPGQNRARPTRSQNAASPLPLSRS